MRLFTGGDVRLSQRTDERSGDDVGGLSGRG